MKHTKLVVGGLAVASLAVVVWFALPDDAQNAVKDTLGITQSAPAATVHAQGKTLDQALSDWGKDARTVINGHPVPPMPDPKINNATVAGVDSDNNGIRDDLDRYIAEKFGNDPVMFPIARAHAKVFQDVFNSPTPKNVFTANKEIHCGLDFSYRPRQGESHVDAWNRTQSLSHALSDLEHQIINSGKRGQVFAAAFAGTGSEPGVNDCSNYVSPR